MFSIVSMLSVFSMFSVFSQTTPCSPIWGSRKEQLLEPLRCRYFLYEMESSQMACKQNDRCETKIAICMQPAVVLCESDGKISIEMPCQRQPCVYKNAKYESIEHLWHRYLVQAKRQLWTKDKFAQGKLCYSGECTF